jgi:hypothetical protein
MPVSSRKMVCFTITLALLLGGTLVLAPTVSAQSVQPAIRTVRFALDQVSNTITTYVFGSGFGQPPTALPYNGDIASFVMSDLTSGWNAGNEGGALCPANSGCYGSNAITGDYLIWSTSEIEVTFDPATAGHTWETGDSVYVAMANPQSEQTASWTGTLAVSPTVQSTTVNGFKVTNASDPYMVAVRQMLAKVPESAVVPASGVPVCTLQAFAVEQVKNGAGLLIIWTIAPSSQFISETSTTRQAKAQVVAQDLKGLLTRSWGLYLAALQADRVPLRGSADFASWWGEPEYHRFKHELPNREGRDNLLHNMGQCCRSYLHECSRGTGGAGELALLHQEDCRSSRFDLYDLIPCAACLLSREAGQGSSSDGKAGGWRPVASAWARRGARPPR